MVDRIRLSNGKLRVVGGAKVRQARALDARSATTMTLADFTSDDPLTHPVVQRKAGTENLMGAPGSGNQPWAPVAVVVSYTGDIPNKPQARVMQGALEVVGWTDLIWMTAGSGVLVGYLPKVPQGTGYKLETRDGWQQNNTALQSVGTRYWGVGVNILNEGQSNMVSGTFGLSYTDIVTTGVNENQHWLNGNVAGAIFGTSGWVKSNGATGSNISNASGSALKQMRITAAALKAKYGYDVPVGVIPWAWNSTGISNNLPGGAAYEKLFNGVGVTASFKSAKNVWPGDFEVAAYHQGENDAKSTTTRAARLADLKAYYQARLDYVKQFGRDASTLWFLPAILGSYGSGTAYIETIRLAVLDLEVYAKSSGWPRVLPAWSCIDLDASADTISGGLHFANAPGGLALVKKSFMRLQQTVLFALGCATSSGLGPRINLADVTRSGDTVTLGVLHERAGAVLTLRDTGSPMTGIAANSREDFSGVDITVISQAIVGGKIQFALSLPNGVTYTSSGLDGVFVKMLGGRVGYANSYRPAIDNLPVDDSQYPSTGTIAADLVTDGLPVVPTDAIRII